MLALVFAHLRRHQMRTLFGFLILGFCVATMLVILATIRGTAGMVDRAFAVDGHDLVFESKAVNVIFGSVTSAQLAGLRALPQIQSAPGHPVIACFGLEPGDPRLERAKWIAGSAGDFGRRKNGVWLGAQAAKFLAVALSEPVEIGRGKFIVAGIFEAENGLENGGVFLSLPAARDFFRRDGVASIAAGTARAATTARMHEVAAAVGVAHRLDHRIHDLSSGERQRVAIGRALMNRPQLIFADEPTGSLDEATAATIFALLRTFVKEQGVAILFATHERRLAEQCDRWLCLRKGKIENS